MEFSEIEQEILNLYLKEKKSIRQIADLIPGYGRSKINNVIERYASISSLNREEVDLVKISQKNHKQITSKSELNSSVLTPEQVKYAHMEIMKGGKTLTELSKELGKNRDTIKLAIIKYLSDKNLIEEFQKKLRKNQIKLKNSQNFANMTDEEKKKAIFQELNNRRLSKGRNTYDEHFLNRKMTKFIDFFEERNQKISSPEDRITIQNLYKMMYDCPTLLSMSLSQKIKPMVQKLDDELLSFSDTSKILKENSAILGTSMERTELQLKILEDSKTLMFALDKPRVFRTSPEFMYALIKTWEENGKEHKTPFIEKSKIRSIYKMTPKALLEMHDIRESKYKNESYLKEGKNEITER